VQPATASAPAARRFAPALRFRRRASPVIDAAAQKTIDRSRAETEEDFYVGTRWDVLNPFDGDWKIMPPDAARSGQS
jgi:hypothetical protein